MEVSRSSITFIHVAALSWSCFNHFFAIL